MLPPQTPERRLVNSLRNGGRGDLGGRMLNAGQLRTLRAGRKYIRPGGDSGQGSVLFKRDRFALDAAGAQTLALSYEPLTDSEHVYLNGIHQDEGVDRDWTRDGQALSLLSTMDPLPEIGDVLVVQYAYRSGEVPLLLEGVTNESWHDHSNTNGWSMEFGSTLVPQTVVVGATISTNATFSGRGTWTTLGSHTYQSRTITVFLGYGFDESGDTITMNGAAAGAAIMYQINLGRIVTTAPTTALSSWSDVYGGDIETGSVSVPAGAYAVGFGGGPAGPSALTGARADSGVTLGSQIIEGDSGYVLAGALGLSGGATASTIWEATTGAIGYMGVMVRVGP